MNGEGNANLSAIGSIHGSNMKKHSPNKPANIHKSADKTMQHSFNLKKRDFTQRIEEGKLAQDEKDMKDIKNGDKLVKSTEKLSLNEDSDKEKNIQKVDDSAESVESENAEDE